MTATNCTASQAYCQTSLVSAGVGSLSITTITKSCQATCVATSLNVVAVTTSISCCNSNLCNTSGALGIKSSSGLLALALGFLFTLLRQSSL
ncbi:hypothetical protein GDO86_018596 [Hymenochirus boettgeri]|uniref:Snake toxin/toxin-like domain-containing protein n=1 Tax=Hymenochirus boettgeri TaxID=247094 RepID=A0A8T2IAB5_9PIPI|nr:hypothetical protein GDO86_018596 [Hymenochirus boettgeri]